MVGALFGFADGDGDLDFVLGGAQMGDVGLDAQVAEPLGDHAHEASAGGLGLGEDLDLGADEGANEAIEHGEDPLGW
jgi:hypothetical protein